MLEFQLTQSFGHVNDTIARLALVDAGNRRQDRRRKFLGSHVLQRVGVGQDCRIAFELCGFEIHECTSHSFINGDAQARDDALARINRHVAGDTGLFHWIVTGFVGVKP